MVSIFLVYSGEDCKAEGNPIQYVSDYLESECQDGIKHAKIIEHPRRNVMWKKSAEKKIREADMVLLLCSDRLASGIGIENICWEIETAKKMDRNVVMCRLAGSMNRAVPDWLSEIDDKIRIVELKALKEQIEFHDSKKYKVFHGSEDFTSLGDDSTGEIAQRLFEQYTLYKQETENKENARDSANNTYLTANAALLALLGVSLEKDSIVSLEAGVIMLVIGIIGLRFCKVWNNTLSYYKQINTAKQRLINYLEKQLPAQLNSVEYYDVMQSPLNKGRYRVYKDVQEGLPNIFKGTWTILLFFAIIILLLSSFALYQSKHLPNLNL